MEKSDSLPTVTQSASGKNRSQLLLILALAWGWAMAEDLCEFEVRLLDISSSRPGGVSQYDPILKEEEEK